MESLVAISILLVAITGPLTIANNSLSFASFAKEQVVATYLAQDAIEYLRSIKDVDGFNTVAQLSSQPVNCSLGCKFDSSVGVVASCPNAICPVLNFNPNNSLFTYDSVAPNGIRATPYTRTVKITSVDEVTLRVTVTVSWASKISGNRSVLLQENFYNFESSQ